MKKILIIDDSLFMRSVLKDLIRSIVVKNDSLLIYEAYCKDSALEKIQITNPDIVFLDIVMGGGGEEGIEILENCRTLLADKIVIMITSVGQPAVIKKCKSLGVKQYIQKPYQYENIYEAINFYVNT